jgi:hypothetical protein
MTSKKYIDYVKLLEDEIAKSIDRDILNVITKHYRNVFRSGKIRKILNIE